MKISNSGANVSSPPPIDWATKPQASPADVINHSRLDDIEEPGSPSNFRRLVPVFINPDHIADLQEALQSLSDPANQQPKLELQVDSKISDAGKVKTVLYIAPPRPRPSQQDANHLPTEDQVLASSISRLFMSTPSPSPTRGQVASVTPKDRVLPTGQVTPTSSNSGSTPLRIVRTALVIISTKATPSKRKYYVILVGKCAGIYFDEWRV